MESTQQTVLGIDPGFIESGWVLFDGERVVEHAKEANWTVLRRCAAHGPRANSCAIEMIQSFGTAVGKETLETIYWIGRFAEAWGDDATLTRYYRKTIAGHLCQSGRASDANIRQALIDRWGGDSVAIGGVKCRVCKGKGWTGREHTPCAEWQHPPGPLHGITKDVWQALAVAVSRTDGVKASA